MSLFSRPAVSAFGVSSAAKMDKHAAACSSPTAQTHRLPSTRNPYATTTVSSAGAGAGAGAPPLFTSSTPPYHAAVTPASLGVAGVPASAGAASMASRPSPVPATSVMHAFDAGNNGTQRPLSHHQQQQLHPQQQHQQHHQPQAHQHQQYHQPQAHQRQQHHQPQAHQHHQQHQPQFQEQQYQHQQCLQQQQQASAGGRTPIDNRTGSMKGIQATNQQQSPRPPANAEEKLRIREKYKQRLQERNVQIYQNALEEVMRKEREEAAKRAIFKINCPTRFGQNVHLVGSHATVGEWGVERAVPMTWGTGNIWSVEVKLPRDANSFEYKYIIKEGPHVIWEPGQNHTLGAEKLRKAAAANAATQVSSADFAYVIEDSWGLGS